MCCGARVLAAQLRLPRAGKAPIVVVVQSGSGCSGRLSLRRRSAAQAVVRRAASSIVGGTHDMAAMEESDRLMYA